MNYKTKKSQKGQTMVETAILLPIVFVLLLGVFEFGRVLMIQHALTNAAREGARVGALLLDDTTALATAGGVTQDYLNKTGIDSGLVTVTPGFTDIAGNPAIEILINYDYSSGLTLWVPGVGPTLQLNSRVVMRREA